MLFPPLDSFIPIPPTVEQVQNATVMEGTDLTKECEVTTGTPPLAVFWENVNSGHIIDGKLLIITNITRYQTEYKCIVNNTCGSVWKTMFIDVHCKNLQRLTFLHQHFHMLVFFPFNEALVTFYYKSAEIHFHYDGKF